MPKPPPPNSPGPGFQISLSDILDPNDDSEVIAEKPPSSPVPQTAGIPSEKSRKLTLILAPTKAVTPTPPQASSSARSKFKLGWGSTASNPPKVLADTKSKKFVLPPLNQHQV